MADVKKTEQHPEEQLWKEMKHVHAGMLGIEGSSSHMQPMGHMADAENGKLWFFSSKDSDLVRELGDGAPAHFCIIGKGQDYHACLMGHLHRNESRAKIDEYWNDMVAAWYTGKDDPNVQLLEFDLIDAAIWASTRNPIKFAWEIQTSKNSPKEPDVGARAHVEFGNGGVREQGGKRV